MHYHHSETFVEINEETLHGAPGWARKLMDNQHVLKKALEALEHRVFELEQKVEAAESADS